MKAWTGNVVDQFDIVIVGSGGAGLTAALCAGNLGATVAVLEKSEYLGGTTAMSGGMIWIPNNHHLRELGIPDDRDSALRYLRLVTQGKTDEAALESFVDHGPEMLTFLETESGVRYVSLVNFPDYHREWDGGCPGGRGLEPEPYPVEPLGALAAEHPPARGAGDNAGRDRGMALDARCDRARLGSLRSRQRARGAARRSLRRARRDAGDRVRRRAPARRWRQGGRSAHGRRFTHPWERRCDRRVRGLRVGPGYGRALPAGTDRWQLLGPAQHRRRYPHGDGRRGRHRQHARGLVAAAGQAARRGGEPRPRGGAHLARDHHRQSRGAAVLQRSG